MGTRTRRLVPTSFMKQVSLPTLLVAVALALIALSVANAQVPTNITSSGLNTTITPDVDPNTYNITGGTRPGGGPNLFHSFGNFSVGAGDTANFVNGVSFDSVGNPLTPGLPTSNILGRVTGGNISQIYGTIQTTDFGNANLFLMNPSGIVLGPGASLNVGGSVSFTTAQYIRLFDTVTGSSLNFYANPANDNSLPNNSILSIETGAFSFLNASPAAYGFLTTPDPSATITVQGSNLFVPTGQSISLVGGDVVIEGSAQLTAPSGKILLASAASPGEFDVNTLAQRSNVDGVSFDTMGSVTLREGTMLNVSGRLDELGVPIGTGASGTVYIRSGQLVMDASTIQANTIGAIDGANTAVEIHVVQDATLSNGTAITTQTSGAGRGGNVQFTVGTTLTLNGSTITTETLGDGNGGNITASATEKITLDGAFINTNTFGLGDGGRVELNAGTFTMDNFSSITTQTLSGGGIGGDVVLNVGTGSFLGGAYILSQALNFTPEGGQGGKVIIQGLTGDGSASGLVNLSGEGTNLTTQTFGGTEGGQIVITTDSLMMGELAIISSEAIDVGSGGRVEVNVKEAHLSGGAILRSVVGTSDPAAQPGPTLTVQGVTANGTMAESVELSGAGSGIFSSTASSASSGDIAVYSREVRLTDGATIQGGAGSNAGAAGDVTIQAESVVISGGSSIASQASNSPAGQITIIANTFILDNSLITTETNSVGRGGDVVLEVGSASLTNGASINTSTQSPIVDFAGNAGDVKIFFSKTGNMVNLASGSSITSSTTGAGNAGQVTVSTPSLTMNNAIITTSTSGTGNAGSITAKVGTLTMTNGSEISSSSTGTATGSAGSITIDGLASPANAVTITDSSVLTSSENTGPGGSITVDATTLALNHATLSASVKDFNALDASDGPAVGTGNIGLAAAMMTMTGGTISAATSGTRNAGTVNLNAGSLSVTNGTITTSTSGNGNAGTIGILTTGNGASLSGGSSITSSTTGTGNAGQVVVTTPTLTLNNATITTGTSSTGNAGSITAKVGTLAMTNGGEISSSSTGTATGSAGSITIDGLASPANTVTIMDSSVLTTAEHTGRGGSIAVDATTLALNNATLSASVKDVPDDADPTIGVANITFSASTMTMNGSTVTAESSGSRNAGDIFINSKEAPGKSLEMFNSQINTSAALADGGNIKIYATDMVRLTDSSITSSVGNQTVTTTRGGNITIDPDYVILQRSQIRANAFAGTGGAIDITAGLFLADASSVVDASSTLGVSGTVQINAPINNLSSVVGRLPESLVAVQTLLRAACAARQAQGQMSSFVERGRDSIPTGPEGLLASPYLPMTSGSSAQLRATPSIGVSGIQLRRLPVKEPPPSVMILSEDAACSS